MTEKELLKLLETLNLQRENELINKKSLSENVELVIIWNKIPKESDETTLNLSSEKYFLIKSENKKYVAIVFDMGHDLHWFVNQNERKKGYLTKALQNTIIPFLLSTKESQRITIKEDEIGKENFLASKNVAKNIGFKQISEFEYIIVNDKDEYHEKYIQIQDYEDEYDITEERMLNLSKKLKFAYQYLELIHSEIELNFRDLDFSENLKEIIEPLKFKSNDFMEIWHEIKRK